MANILKLVPRPRQEPTKLIEMLEKALEEAKSGIVEAAIVICDYGPRSNMKVAGYDSNYTVVAELEAHKANFINQEILDG